MTQTTANTDDALYDIVVLFADAQSSLLTERDQLLGKIREYAKEDGIVSLIFIGKSATRLIPGIKACEYASIAIPTRNADNPCCPKSNCTDIIVRWIYEVIATWKSDGHASASAAVFIDFNLQENASYHELLRGMDDIKLIYGQRAASVAQTAPAQKETEGYSDLECVMFWLIMFVAFLLIYIGFSS